MLYSLQEVLEMAINGPTSGSGWAFDESPAQSITDDVSVWSGQNVWLSVRSAACELTAMSVGEE